MVSKTKLIKPAKNGYIINTVTFTPTRVQKKLINHLYNKIMNSEYKHHYDGTYHTQNYDLKYILSKVVCFIHKCHSWRSLGSGWNNIYKHFTKWCRWGILDDSYIDLLKKYAIKRNGRHLKIVMVDTSIILNKNGSELIKRNSLVKNKFCTKLLSIVDDKGIPIYVNYNPGSMHDSKCLVDILDDFLSKNTDIVSFLGDSGFYTEKIKTILKKHNVRSIIAKNVRNKKTNKKYVDKNGKKRKLTYTEKISRQVEDFTLMDKRKFKKRHKVENVYANFKQKPHFNMRYDKHVNKLYNLTLFYFCEEIFKHI